MAAHTQEQAAQSQAATGGAGALFEVRNSPVHGLGVFALQAIPKGTRLIEYLGERVSHAEADRRYEGKDANDSHTFLFIVDSRTVIDAGVDGNEARFFNHSCDPNCESVIEKRRVYIETVRDVAPGEEMTYDYQIQREADDPANIDEVFACRCGFANCRGTMLWPADPPKRLRRSPRRSATQRKDAHAGGVKSRAGKQGAAGKSGRSGNSGKSGRSGKTAKSGRSEGAEARRSGKGGGRRRAKRPPSGGGKRSGRSARRR